MKVLLILLPLILLFACQQTGNAPKLQGHLAAAKTSAGQTQSSVQSAKNSVERGDYKATRARKILDESVNQ